MTTRRDFMAMLAAAMGTGIVVAGCGGSGSGNSGGAAIGGGGIGGGSNTPGNSTPGPNGFNFSEVANSSNLTPPTTTRSAIRGGKAAIRASSDATSTFQAFTGAIQLTNGEKIFFHAVDANGDIILCEGTCEFSASGATLTDIMRVVGTGDTTADGTVIADIGFGSANANGDYATVIKTPNQPPAVYLGNSSEGLLPLLSFSDDAPGGNGTLSGDFGCVTLDDKGNVATVVSFVPDGASSPSQGLFYLVGGDPSHPDSGLLVSGQDLNPNGLSPFSTFGIVTLSGAGNYVVQSTTQSTAGSPTTPTPTPTPSPSPSPSPTPTPVGPPTALSFLVPPANGAPNTAITPPIEVAVVDANGNIVNTSTATVSLALAGAAPATLPSPAATLGGTTSVAAIAGVATFSNLTVSLAGTGYQLVASSNGLNSATSSSFNISGSAPAFAVPKSVTNDTVGLPNAFNLSGTIGNKSSTRVEAAPKSALLSPLLAVARDTPSGSSIYAPRITSGGIVVQVIHVSNSDLVLYYGQTIIAQTGGLSPSGNTIMSMIAPVCGPNNHVFYVLFTTVGIELVMYDGTTATTILSRGNVINGRTINGIIFGSMPNQVDDQDRITLIVEYTDGTSGILVGIPV